MKKLFLLVLFALPLCAMQKSTTELLKEEIKQRPERLQGYFNAAAVGGFAGYTVTNVAVLSIIASPFGIVSVPIIAAGAGIGVASKYVYNKYVDFTLQGTK